MRTAVVVAVLFAIFIALVEWRRHYAERDLSKGLDARVSVERARLASTRAPSTRRSSRSASLSSGSATPDAGAPTQGAEASGNPRAPRDREAERKKAVAAMDAIQRLMDAERRDDDWAAAVETWVRANYGKRPGSRLERIECRKTLCSADGTHDTQQLYEDWVSRFTGHDRGLRVMTMPEVLPSGKTRARTFILKDAVATEAR